MKTERGQLARRRSGRPRSYLHKEVHQSQALRFKWLTLRQTQGRLCDEAFGRDSSFLDEAGKIVNYFAEVPLDTRAWLSRLKTGVPIIADFAVLDVIAVRDGLPIPAVKLVFRRNSTTGELKAFLSNAPDDTPLTISVNLSSFYKFQCNS